MMNGLKYLWLMPLVFVACDKHNSVWDETAFLTGTLVLALLVWIGLSAYSNRAALKDKRTLTKLIKAFEEKERRLEELRDLELQITNKQAISERELKSRISVLEKELETYGLRQSNDERGKKLLAEIRQQPRSLSEIELDNLADFVNGMYRSYVDRLRLAHPALTRLDLWYCCLVRLEFSSSDIATLLQVTPTTISQRKLRVKKHLNMPLPKGMELNQYLKEL